MMTTLIPHCEDCRVKLIVSQFGNGVVRFLCPECGGKFYAKEMEEYGLVRDRYYSTDLRYRDDWTTEL